VRAALGSGSGPLALDRATHNEALVVAELHTDVLPLAPEIGVGPFQV
jgi:hypothetical protein